MNAGLLSVLYFSNSLVRGGAEEHVLTLLRVLDRTAFRPNLVCTPEVAAALLPNLPDDVEMIPLTLRKPVHLGAAFVGRCLDRYIAVSEANGRYLVRDKGLPPEKVTVIRNGSDLERLGIRFPDRRNGHLVFLLDPGRLITSSDSNASGWQPTGMHGYDPDDSYSEAISLSTHELPVRMRTITDTYASMLHWSGLQDAIVGPPPS